MLKNIASNWLLSVATIAVTFVLTPFTFHALGETGFGTWLLITSMTGYLMLLALGVPMASVRYMTHYAAEGKQRELNAVIGSSASLYATLGAIAFVIGCVLFAFFESTYDVPASLQSQARIGFFLVVLYVSAGFIGQLPSSILMAHHEFVRRNAVMLATLLLRLGLTLTLLTLKPALVSLALVLIAALVFEYSVLWMVIRRRYPAIRLNVRDFSRHQVRLIFSFSVFVL